MQAITDPTGHLLWIAAGIRGAIHDTAAARIWLISQHLRAAGLVALGDIGYDGLDPKTTLTPYKGRDKPEPRKAHNRLHAKLHAHGDPGHVRSPSVLSPPANTTSVLQHWEP